MREAFVRHSGLVAVVNDAIGPLILLSVFMNLGYLLIVMVYGYVFFKY